MTRADVHVFTARIPHEEYERLRLYAFTARVSINDVVLTAVRTLLEQERVEVPRDGTELGEVILDALRSRRTRPGSPGSTTTASDDGA